MPIIREDLAMADAFGKDFRFLWFSDLMDRFVTIVSTKNRIGKLSDIVFELTDPHPVAVGIYLEHGWGKPTEFIPWECVDEIGRKAIFVKAPEGESYPPFTDQPGWILVNQSLMGRTILDTDGRRVEVVNDVHLLESKGRMIIAHVDVSFNGFLRRWGLGKLRWMNDRLISWRYVQPFSVEDASKTDTVSLSTTRDQAKRLPSEDLADVVEMLSGDEQQAFFSILDTEKAAETLIHAEPRAKRQLIEDLSDDRARDILSELSIPQLDDLFSVLPHHDVSRLILLLSPEIAGKISQMLTEQEVKAHQLVSCEFMAFSPNDTVGSVLKAIRTSHAEHEMITYLYVVTKENVLVGIMDLRKLLLADDATQLAEIMSPSVVAAEEEATREQVEELFEKYRYRMIPVVDRTDHLLGVIRFNDLVQSLST